MNAWLRAIPLVLCGALVHAEDKSPSSYDPAALDVILKEYVNAAGLVDYARLKENRGALDAFIKTLGDLDPAVFETWPAPDQIAFYINAYNAITLQRIVDHYPIKVTNPQYPANSIRQIEGVWDRLTTRVLGRDMTLDHIEHEILRKQYGDPRLHTTLVCGSVGCPPLRGEAYTGAKLGEQMDDQSRRFLAQDFRFRLERDKQIVLLSPILKWYGKDFVGTYNKDSAINEKSPELGAALDFTSQYVSPGDAQAIRSGDYDVKFLEYDWSLNEQP